MPREEHNHKTSTGTHTKNCKPWHILSTSSTPSFKGLLKPEEYFVLHTFADSSYMSFSCSHVGAASPEGATTSRSSKTHRVTTPVRTEERRASCCLQQGLQNHQNPFISITAQRLLEFEGLNSCREFRSLCTAETPSQPP